MNETVGIVGNPNCGKTTLFNRLTGSRQRVGNWPGVTVERKEGVCRHRNGEITVVDLPGIYALAAQSADEQVARDYLLSGEAGVVINIVDAANLERNLYLTVQLMEMGNPMIVALNMMDIARKQGLTIDPEALSRQLGCPVIPIVAKGGEGLETLLEQVREGLSGAIAPPRVPPLPGRVEEAVARLASEAPLVASLRAGINPRWAALKMIEGDGGGPSGESAMAAEARETLERESGEEPDILLADARYAFIGELMREISGRRAAHPLTERLDRLVLHRLLGIPVFLGVLYLMFMFTINLGGVFIDFFDILFGAFFVEGTRHLLSALDSPDWLITLLADGLGGSVQTLATFIPPIGFMFLFLSWLEDSGYMARAAFIMDRFLRFMGLPGKAFIPMMVGFGCNVPAIMGTRTLENQRDRTLAIMMNPFMSCGARMPVYALFAAAFFPSGGQNVVFALYLVGVAFAVATGLILKHTLLRGEPTPFLMELPPYHLPTLRGVATRAWERLQGFVTRASRVLIPAIMVLSFFNSLGWDGHFGHENSERSLLASASRVITPLFSPMGIQEENWPATVGLFTGVFAKEAVVGTLNALYGQMDAAAAPEEGAWDPAGRVREAVGSIGANLAALGDTLLDPLGLGVEEFTSLEEAAANQAVDTVVFGAMTGLFDGRIGAFGYLLFVLLYFPCLAATSAIYQETNGRWALFAGVWTTALAYSAATCFYQAATLPRHPGSSLAWLSALAVIWVGIVSLLAAIGNRREKPLAGSRLACEEA